MGQLGILSNKYKEYLIMEPTYRGQFPMPKCVKKMQCLEDSF